MIAEQVSYRNSRGSVGVKTARIAEEEEDQEEYGNARSDSGSEDELDEFDAAMISGPSSKPIDHRRCSNFRERLQVLNNAGNPSTRRISLAAEVHSMGGRARTGSPNSLNPSQGSPRVRASMYSMGNRLSTVPVSRSGAAIGAQEGMPHGQEDKKGKKRATMSPNPYDRSGNGKVKITDFIEKDGDGDDEKGTPGIRKRTSNGGKPHGKTWKDKIFKTPGRMNFVRFEPTGAEKGTRSEAGFTGRYVDELAIERSQRSHRHKLTAKSNAILHHRDSILSGSKLALDVSMAHPSLEELGGATGSTSVPRTLRPLFEVVPQVPMAQGQRSPVRALRSVSLFASCSAKFLKMLAAGCEVIQLKPGEVRDIGGVHNVIHPGEKTSAAMAVVVDRGACRVEVGHTIVSECVAGSSFGLANVLVGVAATSGRPTARPAAVGPLTEYLVRGGHDTCRCIIVSCMALRRALSERPHRSACFQEMLKLVNQQVDGTQHLAAYLNCCDQAKAAITGSCTREVYAAGERVVIEGDKIPDALLFIRSGTVALEIKGVEVRRIRKGQVVGEEMLFGVSRKWAVSVLCITACDVQLLHRHLFISSVFKMQEGNTEDKRESQRLLTLIDGTWKEDKVHLAWPLFRGYDQNLLAKLAGAIETRVVLPGSKLWENVPSWCETALYFILSGIVEETQTTERPVRQDASARQRAMQQADSKCTKRTLVPGACLGAREFLGLQSVGHVVVKSSCLCLVAVLHRRVYLHILDSHEVKGHQASEVTRLLQEDLDSQEEQGVAKKEQLLIKLSLFRGHDKAFVDRIQKVALRRFCITGQYLCRSGITTNSLFVPIRGSVRLQIDGIDIREYKLGKEINAMALANGAFMPYFSAVCEKTSELLEITRASFMACLKSFNHDRRKVEELLQIPSVVPDLFMHLSCGGVLMNHEHLDNLPFAEDDGSSLMGSKMGSRVGSIGPLASRQLSLKGVSGVSPVSRCESPGAREHHDSVLSQVDFLKECSAEYLHWLETHLEAAVWFPDDVVLKEGEADTSFYLLRSGTLVVEGSGTGGAQEPMNAGANFGEQRLFGLNQSVKATYLAIEVSVLQVLHRSVFQRSLELFPDQMPHFDRVTLQRLENSQIFDLAVSPFFYGCNRDFNMQINRLMITQLVHPGELIVGEGEESTGLKILKVGVAVAEDEERQPSKRLESGAVLNADLVLGVTRCAVANVRAEKLCAVGQVDSLDFLGLLQRFPQEIMPLLQVAVGQLFPTEAETVPLFRGVNSYFFNQLMEKSEWHMFLADHCVVRQGGSGQMMFLLCYGVAVRKADGVIVGAPLLRGECIGKANLFGMSGKYNTSVFTQTVCHFRTILSYQLSRLLKDHAAEHERFESLKIQVQAELAEQEQEIQEEVTREKLRRRTEHSFRKHVAREREARGLEPNDSTASLGSQSSLLESLAQKGRKDSSRGRLQRQMTGDSEVKSDSESSSDEELSPRRKKKTEKGKHLVDLTDGLHPKKLNALVEKIKHHREHGDEDGRKSPPDQIWSEEGRATLKPNNLPLKENKAGSVDEPLEFDFAATLTDGSEASPKSPRTGNNRQTLSAKKGGKRKTRKRRQTDKLRPRAASPRADPDSPRIVISPHGGEHWNGGEHWTGQDGSDSSSDGGAKPKPISRENSRQTLGTPNSRGLQADATMPSILKVCVTDVDSRRASVDGDSRDMFNSMNSSTDSFEKVFVTKIHNLEDAKQMSKRQLIDAAIAEHAGARQHAILRGRVLRVLYNGLPLDTAARGHHQLSQEDLHTLSLNLPQLPPPGTPSVLEEEVANGMPPALKRQKEHKEALLCGGVPPKRSMLPSRQKAMRRKYMQLTGQRFAVLPCA